jgi:hypothetical protein
VHRPWDLQVLVRICMQLLPLLRQFHTAKAGACAAITTTSATPQDLQGVPLGGDQWSVVDTFILGIS